MKSRTRLAAWIVTGPLGHLWSALADMAILWTRYLRYRIVAGAGSALSRRR